MTNFVKKRSFENGDFNLNWYILDEFKNFVYGDQYEVDVKENTIHVKNGVLYDIMMNTKVGEGEKWEITKIVIKTQHTPETCYLRGLTYNAVIMVELTDDHDNEFRPRMYELFQLPVMVGTFHMFHSPLPSNQCCQFIINGLNIALIHIEKHALQVPLLRFRDNMSECYVKNSESMYFSVVMTETKGMQVKIRSESFKWNDVMFLIESKDIIKVREFYPLPEEEEEEEELDKEVIFNKVLKLLRYDPLLANKEYTHEELIRVFCDHLLLSFLPDWVTWEQKLSFLFQCATKCWQLHHGYLLETDLDNVGFKRYLTATEHVRGLFLRHWYKYIQSIEALDAGFVKKRDQFTKTIRKPFSDPSAEFAFHTASPVRLMKEGTSILNALTIFRSYLLKIHPENMDMTIRIWNGASHGFVDPIATPEGKQVGLVNHFTFLAEVSRTIKTEHVYEHIKHLCHVGFLGKGMVYLNCVPIGTMIHDKVYWLIRRIKLNYFPTMSVVLENDDIYIQCDSGRILRPLEILETGWIEWVDCKEQERVYICQKYEQPTKEHTHRVLHDCDTISIQAACLPFIHHDKAARNLISSVMMGQAVGFHLPQNRYNTEISYNLVSAQPKVNETDIGKLAKLPQIPVSTNVVIAITALPDNVDDSIVVNKAFVERDGFLIEGNQWYRFVLPKAHHFGKPSLRPLQIPLQEWDKIGNDGIIAWTPSYHPIVTSNTPLAIVLNHEKKIAQVYRLSPTTNTRNIEEIDYIYRVTNVVHSEDECGNSFVMIKITHLRPAQVGDKLTSLSGQKGVIGKLIHPNDLPYSVNTGTVPDIFVNPHGIFSRCTVGQLIDMIASVGVMFSNNDLYCNSSPFDMITDVEQIQQVLRERGLNGGYEMFVDGRTGQQLMQPQYVGIVPYAKLVHFSSDKCTAANQPHVDFETKAPVKGRKNHGGVRFGEMEYAVAGSHGCSLFLKEKLGELSDGVMVNMCEQCHVIGNKCTCQNKIQTRIPYATMALKRRLICANMDFNIKRKKESQI